MSNGIRHLGIAAASLVLLLVTSALSARPADASTCPMAMSSRK
jgi:hypothetical protein